MNMTRVFNFSAGPSALPTSVLEKAQREMLDYQNTGMCVMEMSHRASVYQGIIDKAEADFRKLLNISNEYAVLFMHGGASAQFAGIPMNLMVNKKKAAFIDTGEWSRKAISEAKKYGEVVVVASSEDKKYSFIPNVDKLAIPEDIDYFHIVNNNTIEGTRFTKLPKVKVPLVADMSSCILSEEINVNDYGLIFAGAQKNVGPSGLCLVIVKRSLMGKQMPITPKLMNYKVTEENGSMTNTPSTYSIYIAGLVFEWLLNLGGVKAIQKINIQKADLLYDILDSSKFYHSPVNKADRSIMNIPFATKSEELDSLFVKEATKAGLVNLKGHRSVGGMRASIYNAMTLEGVQALVEFMSKFEKVNK